MHEQVPQFYMDVITYPRWFSKSLSVKQAPAICARYISLMSPVKRRWGLRWVQRRVNALHMFLVMVPYVISYNVYTSTSYRAWSVLLNTQYAYQCFNVFGFLFSDERSIWQRHMSSCIATFQTNSKKTHCFGTHWNAFYCWLDKRHSIYVIKRISIIIISLWRVSIYDAMKRLTTLCSEDCAIVLQFHSRLDSIDAGRRANIRAKRSCWPQTRGYKTDANFTEQVCRHLLSLGHSEFTL